MKWLKSAVIAAIFVLCIVLIVVGQKHIGVFGLLVMIAGLVGILALLYMYNRKYK